MFTRKQGDIIPLWDIVLFESEEELLRKQFKGSFDQAVIKAEKLLESYKSMDDIFKVTHYTVE